jgi:hypothetical protein
VPLLEVFGIGVEFIDHPVPGIAGDDAAQALPRPRDGRVAARHELDGPDDDLAHVANDDGRHSVRRIRGDG